MSKDRAAIVAEATEYLRTGGIGEVIGLADMAFTMGHPKIQMDTDMALALAVLAAEQVSCLRCAAVERLDQRAT